MINWDETAAQLGRTDLKGKRPVVMCECDTCHKQRPITIRNKSKIIDWQMSWICPSCVMLRPEQSSRASRQAAERCTKSYREERSQSSKQLWQTNGFAEKHSAAVKEVMASVDMSEILIARYSDDNAREILRKKSLSLFANPDFKQRHSDTMARADTRLRISDGLRRIWLDEGYRAKALKARLQQKTRTSKLQEMLYQILGDLNVPYFREGEDTAIGFYLFDCLVPRTSGRQLLIECQGDYWHSSDKATRQDKAKFTYIDRYFPDYQIIYFWEREFYQKDRVRGRLMSLLGIENKIDEFNLNDVSVRTVGAVKDFLDLYHYMGPGRGGRRIGAYVGDDLAAVAVFSSPGRQNISNKFSRPLSEIIECSRFCINPRYQKKNFGSWFLSRCVKVFSNKLLIAYADTTAGHDGTIYKAANWQFHHEVPADYWYADVDGFVMHKKTLYNRAVNLKMTEAEFATTYGFIKIWGGKKLCFIKKV